MKALLFTFEEAFENRHIHDGGSSLRSFIVLRASLTSGAEIAQQQAQSHRRIRIQASRLGRKPPRYNAVLQQPLHLEQVCCLELLVLQRRKRSRCIDTTHEFLLGKKMNPN